MRVPPPEMAATLAPMNTLPVPERVTVLEMFNLPELPPPLLSICSWPSLEMLVPVTVSWLPLVTFTVALAAICRLTMLALTSISTPSPLMCGMETLKFPLGPPGFVVGLQLSPSLHRPSPAAPVQVSWVGPWAEAGARRVTKTHRRTRTGQTLILAVLRLVEIDPAHREEDDPVRQKSAWLLDGISVSDVNFGEFIGVLLENQRFIWFFRRRLRIRPNHFQG